MNRRNILVGLGTAAAGSGVVLGSGAFTQVSSARNVTIGVDNDSSALVELNAGNPTVVEENPNGELEISTDNFGGAFTENATVKIGDISDPSSTPAFSVTNSFGDQIDLILNLIDIDSNSNFTLYFDKNAFGDTDETVDANDETTGTLGSTETLNVAIEVDTQSADDNFAGTLAVSAKKSSTE